MKRLFYWITLAVVVSGCVYPYDVELQQDNGKVLVVEGKLQTGGASWVNLSYVKPVNGKQTSFPSGTAYLEDSAGHRYEPNGDGRNFYFDTSEASSDLSYRVVVTDNGKTYESDWVKPLAPPTLDEVVFEADDNNVYVKVSLQAGSEGSGYAAVQFEEAWMFHTDYLRQYYYNEENNTIGALIKPDERHYYCWKQMDWGSNTLIDYRELDGKVSRYTLHSFSRYDNRNHKTYSILVKIRNLTPEEYRYRKTLDDNNDIGGDLFSPEPGQVASNVHCVSDKNVQVLGYVNISQLVSKRYYLDDRYYKHRDPGGLVLLSQDEYLKYYEKGYLPVDYVHVDNGYGIGWGLPRCYDCVAAGGSLVEPDFIWDEAYSLDN